MKLVHTVTVISLLTCLPQITFASSTVNYSCEYLACSEPDGSGTRQVITSLYKSVNGGDAQDVTPTDTAHIVSKNCPSFDPDLSYDAISHSSSMEIKVKGDNKLYCVLTDEDDKVWDFSSAGYWTVNEISCTSVQQNDGSWEVICDDND